MRTRWCFSVSVEEADHVTHWVVEDTLKTRRNKPSKVSGDSELWQHQHAYVASVGPFGCRVVIEPWIRCCADSPGSENRSATTVATRAVQQQFVTRRAAERLLLQLVSLGTWCGAILSACGIHGSHSSIFWHFFASYKCEEEVFFLVKLSVLWRTWKHELKICFVYFLGKCGSFSRYHFLLCCHQVLFLDFPFCSTIPEALDFPLL